MDVFRKTAGYERIPVDCDPPESTVTLLSDETDVRSRCSAKKSPRDGETCDGATEIDVPLSELLSSSSSDGSCFCCGTESAVEYITLSSYGGDAYDFYGCSEETPFPGAQPMFTRHVFLFLISTFIVRPACCALFLTYGKFTKDYRLFELCLATTLCFYGTKTIELFMIYGNVKTDRMPMSRRQRTLAGVLEVLCAGAFIWIASCILFYDGKIFARSVRYPRPPTYGDSIDGLTAVVVLTTTLYSVLSASCAIGFVMPRVWVFTTTKTGIPF